MTSFAPDLDAARAALSDVIQDDNQQTRKDRAGDFMCAIGRLGRALGASPSEAAALPAEVAAFVADTAPILRDADGGLGLWLLDANQYNPENDSSYQAWLSDRSAIESLRQLYRGTVAETYTAEFDTEDMDDLIRYKARYFNTGQRPSGIPDSHWWWG